MDKIVINELVHGIKVYDYGVEYLIDMKALKEKEEPDKDSE